MTTLRQWDIYLFPFQQESPHPVVVIFSDEVCQNPDLIFVNALMCVSLRADRPLKKREMILDQADGLDWRTAVRCDFIYALRKDQFEHHRGRVSDARQLELLRKLRFCFRWPAV